MVAAARFLLACLFHVTSSKLESRQPAKLNRLEQHTTPDLLQLPLWDCAARQPKHEQLDLQLLRTPTNQYLCPCHFNISAASRISTCLHATLGPLIAPLCHAARSTSRRLEFCAVCTSACTPLFHLFDTCKLPSADGGVHGTVLRHATVCSTTMAGQRHLAR